MPGARPQRHRPGPPPYTKGDPGWRRFRTVMGAMHFPGCLTTARLELRPVTADDLDPLAGLYADPAVMRYVGPGVPLSRDHAAVRLRLMLDHWQDHGFGLCLVRDRTAGTVLGRCGLSYLGDTGAV